jgi:hypothetical protein
VSDFGIKVEVLMPSQILTALENGVDAVCSKISYLVSAGTVAGAVQEKAIAPSKPCVVKSSGASGV